MDFSMVYIFFGVCLPIGLIVQFVAVRRRHSQDYLEKLAPILEECGLRCVSSEFPGWFQVGPFPKFEAHAGRSQSSVSFRGSGEYNEYRIVTVSDEKGEVYKLWALLQFELFALHRVRWRVETGEVVPEAARSIIET